jgi:hypothetical protein
LISHIFDRIGEPETHCTAPGKGRSRIHHARILEPVLGFKVCYHCGSWWERTHDYLGHTRIRTKFANQCKRCGRFMPVQPDGSMADGDVCPACQCMLESMGMAAPGLVPIFPCDNRAAAEKAAAIADGERRRDASLDSLDDYRLLLRLRRTVREVAADTGLEPVEAAKTSECHELLKALVERS